MGGAARAPGATAIVVKDGHGDASNINPLAMPEYVTLIRGKSGHPYNMMFGLDETFDGVFFLGYHAAAGNPEFAISHTSTGNSQYIRLNGRYMSEFMLNTYTASSLGIPVLFLSGDEAVCRDARELAPHISTAEIKRGVGMLMTTDAGTGFMHESFNVNDPTDFTRSWFAWQNTLFGELILKLVNEGKINLLNSITVK